MKEALTWPFVSLFLLRYLKLDALTHTNRQYDLCLYNHERWAVIQVYILIIFLLVFIAVIRYLPQYPFEN